MKKKKKKKKEKDVDENNVYDDYIMSILEQRVDLNDKIKHVLFSLQYKHNPIKLVGSAAIKSQRYYGDFDCMSAVNKKDSAKEMFDEFNDIIARIKKDPDLYFIELKIQTTDKKFKYHKDDKLDLKTIQDNLKDINFFKIDLSMWFDYHFSDVSIIYQLFGDELTKDSLGVGIRDEIKELTDDGQYYKVLKRKFLIYRINGDDTKLKALTKIFNSELGLKYKVASNIEALELVLTYYHDPHTKERVRINLKMLHLEHYSLSNLDKEAKKLKKEINEKAEILNRHFPI